MNKNRMKLILFDIDGILIRSKSMNITSKLMEKYFHVKPFETKIYMEGKTFRWILKERLIEAGIKDPEKNPKFREALEDIAPINEAIKKGIKIEKIKNVENLIKLLLERKHILGLLTGNTEKSAEIKLRRVKLWDYFKIGAFGSEIDNRSDLVDIAIKDAENKTGIKFKKEDILIIGDTVEDIKCAISNQVKIVAIATGLETLEKLKSKNPDYLFQNFDNIQEIVRSIEN